MGTKVEIHECGDAAKSDFFMRLIFPVMLGGVVVPVILVGKGEPEVDIKQIHPFRDSGGFQILPMRLISSSSSSACSSRLSRGVMRGVSGVRGMTTGGGSRCSEWLGGIAPSRSPDWIYSVIRSFNVVPCWAARVLTSLKRAFGRSMVVRI